MDGVEKEVSVIGALLILLFFFFIEIVDQYRLNKVCSGPMFSFGLFVEPLNQLWIGPQRKVLFGHTPIYSNQHRIASILHLHLTCNAIACIIDMQCKCKAGGNHERTGDHNPVFPGNGNPRENRLYGGSTYLPCSFPPQGAAALHSTFGKSAQ